MGQPSVSVVLAAFDEAPTIAEVVAGCRSSTPGLVEVIVVDDGSNDATAAEARRAGARVLGLERNRGKGYALRHGISRSKGDVLVFLDADGQDSPEEIPRLLDALEPGVDLVIGSRFLGHFDPGAISGLNRLGTRFLTSALNSLFHSRVTDPLAGFRAVRRAACVGKLRADRYDIEVDLLLAVLQSGGKVVEVPVSRSARRYGASHLRSFRDGTRILGRILYRRLPFTGN